VAPGTLVVVDDCLVATHEFIAEDPDRLWEVHVGLAWQHAVAMRLIEPLPGDVCSDCNLCLGRYTGLVL
jgi:hypothetical protein